MGMLGAVTSRAEAQVVRLSCLYALLDSSKVIRRQHMTAALAVWRYCETPPATFSATPSEIRWRMQS